MLDREVLVRRLKAAIDMFPVQARHRGKQFTVRMMATEDIIQAVEAGTRDDMSMGIVASRDDFQGVLPKSMDDMDILFGDEWVTFQIRNVPTYFDPILHTIQINLQSPQKGIT